MTILGTTTGVPMVTMARDTGREFALLWGAVGRILRARGALLALLFLLGWVGYFATVLATGFTAPRLPWAVIPLMGAGCLVQLVVTLAAYRTSIEEAESAWGGGERLSLVAMISTLLVPFAAAYSAFGFFSGYARDGMVAASAMVGSYAETAFLGEVNPIASTRTLLISLGAFVLLWVSARLVKAASQRTKSAVLALVSSFISSCTTFLVIFSIFRIYSVIGTWFNSRVFMSWRDKALDWAGGLIHADLPHAVDVAWNWIWDVAWPIFWYALSRPIVWLAVVALVGGMQFLNVNTVWSRLRNRLGIRGEHELATGLAMKAGKSIVSFVSGLLPIFHLLSVILKSGVPFLSCLILSYAVVDRLGEWLSYLVTWLIGPLEYKWVFMVYPVLKLTGMVIVAGIEAVLLAAAYVRLKQKGLEPARLFGPKVGPEGTSGQRGRFFLAQNQPEGTVLSGSKSARKNRPLWPVIAAVVSIALAAGINQIVPPSPDRMVAMTAGSPAVLMESSVVISDVRAGRSVSGDFGSGSSDPVSSQGVFVAVRVTLSSDVGASAVVSANVSGVSYPTWDQSGRITTPAGFAVTRDMVFEIPRSQLGEVVILVTPSQILSLTTVIGHFSPDDVDVEESIVVDENQTQEVI